MFQIPSGGPLSNETRDGYVERTAFSCRQEECAARAVLAARGLRHVRLRGRRLGHLAWDPNVEVSIM